MLNRDFMQQGFFPWLGEESVLDGRNYPFHNVKSEKHNVVLLICPSKAWRWVLSDWVRFSGNLAGKHWCVFHYDWFALPEIWGSIFVIYAPQFPVCFFNNMIKHLAGWLFYAVHANRCIFSCRFQRTSTLTWTLISRRVSCVLTLQTLTPPL